MFEETFNQLMSIFIDPEIKTRRDRGVVRGDFKLRAFQIIFFPDGKPTLVRLNEEVKAEMIIHPKRGVNKSIGEILTLAEIERIQEFKLIEVDLLDCGHVTALNLFNNWTFSFDFKYNKSTANAHHSIAKEFLEVAEDSLKKGYRVPFIDNLFSSLELAAKSLLIDDFDSELLKSKKHSKIHDKLNSQTNIGNIKEEFRELFNKISDMRQTYRYLHRQVDFSIGDCQIWLKKAKKVIGV